MYIVPTRASSQGQLDDSHRALDIQKQILVMQDMLESWSNPFKAAYGSNAAAQYYELSFVESAVSRHVAHSCPGLHALL